MWRRGKRWYAQGTKLIRILPARSLGGFPLPGWDWIWIRPQPPVLGPGELFEIPETWIPGTRSFRPRESFLHQFTPYVLSVWKENLRRGLALLISRERPNYDVTVPDESGCHMLGLFTIGLFGIGTVDVFEINCLTSAIVTDRDPITFMDSDDFCGKIRPRERRTGCHQDEPKTGYDTMLLHGPYANALGRSSQRFLVF